MRKLYTTLLSAKKSYLFFILIIATIALHAQPGTLDTSFNPGSGANDRVYDIKPYQFGKVLIGGVFTTFGGTAKNRIALLNSYGTLDATFGVGSGANSSIYAIAVLPDNKILIGGAFTTYNGTPINRIARLNANGTLDPTFNPGTGGNNLIISITVLPNGKILTSGVFITFNGVSRRYIARLNSNGSLDLTFDPGTGANDYIVSHVLQPDGKIIIGGNFHDYNGIVRHYVARLNSNGSLDTSFNPGGGPNNGAIAGTVRAIALQPDGKIIIGGDFTSYDGTARNYIARLYTDGTLDTTFSKGIAANNLIHKITIQNNGKILIGGAFITYDGIGRNRLARLNSNGSLDTSFDPGSGTDSDVWSIVPQPDGTCFINGFFTTYNGTSRNRLAKVLSGFGGSALNFDGINDDVNLGSSLGNFGNSDFTIELSARTSLGHTYLASKSAACNTSEFWNLKIENGKAQFEIMQNSAGASQLLTGTTTVNDSLWHRLAVNRKNGALKLFIDGNEEASGIFAGNPNNGASLVLGTNACNGVNGSVPFAGNMDELRIWNVARSQELLARSNYCELLGNPPGLLAYYTFNQGSDNQGNSGVTTLLDATGNYPGTLNNFALAGTSSNWIAAGSFPFGENCGIYEFTGNGNFSVAANWLNGAFPPNPIESGSMIHINPQAGGQCLLDMPYASKLGSSITVAPGSNFVVPGTFTIESDFKDTGETKPQYDNTNLGVYRGAVVGSFGTIVFDIKNENTNVSKAILRLNKNDGTLLNETLTTTTNITMGQPISNVLFTGTTTSLRLSADANGDNPLVSDMQVPGHPAIAAVLFHEQSGNPVRIFAGSAEPTDSSSVNTVTIISRGFLEPAKVISKFANDTSIYRGSFIGGMGGFNKTILMTSSLGSSFYLNLSNLGISSGHPYFYSGRWSRAMDLSGAKTFYINRIQ